jgi:hypothetical protein
MVDQEVLDAVLARQSPGEQSCPAGRADWRGAKRVCEPNAGPSEIVDVRSFDLLIAVTSEHPSREIIREDDEYIRALYGSILCDSVPA